MSDTAEKQAGFNLKQSLQEIRAEFNKVIWPSRADLVKQTVTVIITSAIIGLIISGFDLAANFCHTELINLVK